MTNFSISSMQASDKQVIFKRYVNDHSDVLFNYAVHHGFDVHNAKDLVQETFISAWRNIDGFNEKASVRNWLFVIMKNKIVDHYRKVANNIVIESIEADHHDHTFFDEHDHWRAGMHPKEWSVNFVSKTEANDFQRIFETCNSKLKEIQSAVFVKKYVDGLNSEEICKELGITTSNYWVILHRAKVQLRACLEKNWLLK